MRERDKYYDADNLNPQHAGIRALLGTRSGRMNRLDILKGAPPHKDWTPHIKDATDCVHIIGFTQGSLWLLRVPPWGPNHNNAGWELNDAMLFKGQHPTCSIKQVGPRSFYKITSAFGLEHLIDPVPGLSDGVPVTVAGGKGATCVGKRCPEPFHPWAEPNQPNGTFICYSCRNSF